MKIPKDIVFSDSYVIGLRIEPYLVCLAMDFVLTPEHPSYAPPGPDEHECFRRGEIRIHGFERLTWKATGVLPSHDGSGEFDFGNLDELENTDGGWRMSGDWGVINIVGGDLRIEIFDR